MEVPVTVKEIEYVPKWNDNATAAEPVQVTLRYLNTSQRSTLLPWQADGKGNVTLVPDYPNLIPAAVVKVTGLWQTIDGERREVKNGRDIMQGYGFDALVLELTSKIIEMNPRASIEKNS